jgi:hypothetical protein
MPRDTSELIRTLVAQVEPVRPLPPPWRRAVIWLGLAVPYVGIVAFTMTPRPDLVATMTEGRFLREQLAALALGIAAAMAAFGTVIPGYRHRSIVWLIAPLVVWLSSLGQGCIQELIQTGAHRPSLQSDWSCFPGMLAAGTIPLLAMAAMLRRGAPLTPTITMTLGGLAAGGLGDFGLRFVHHRDAGVSVLIWHVGAMLALCALGAWAGRFLGNWRSDAGERYAN